MAERNVFYRTKDQRAYPYPEKMERLLVPIISIDHLSDDFQDLPVDDILAIGDQALLHKIDLDLKKKTSRTQDCRPSVSQPPVGSFAFDDDDAGDAALDDTILASSNKALLNHQMRLFQHEQMKESISNTESIFPAVDQQFDDSRGECFLPHTFESESRGETLLSQSITEPDVLGPLVDNLYGTLNSLERRGPCEILLYLSGHGMDPGNICLVPDTIKPHPSRNNLRGTDPGHWYPNPPGPATSEQEYLSGFYNACVNAIGACEKPLGFVGGEVYAHQRGFIGVLGVLGLWCHAHHREVRNNVFHHLVIVADCCFAGIWGTTLESILNSAAPCLKDYCELLQKYPVSIQCATYEFEASHGGVFTPLWYFLNTDPEFELDRYHREDPASSDEIETQLQHPWYVSTSSYRPKWKCFDDPALFACLHGKQLKELAEDLRDKDNERALEDACTSQEPETITGFNDIEKEFKRLKHFSPLVRPLVTAFVGAAFSQRDSLRVQENNLRYYSRYPQQQPGEGIAQAKNAICSIKQSLAALQAIMREAALVDPSNLLFSGIPRSRGLPLHYFLDVCNNVAEKYHEKLKSELRPCDREYDVPPGVYVFQGGEGDMSLIVTPDQKEVILIDGTKNAACFKAAWDSTLKYLRRITHIFVTHHDEDHTYGIQLLLARYRVGATDSLPDIRHTIIYMNTRPDFLRRNFRHEMEIETLAKQLGVKVKPFIVEGKCKEVLRRECFFIAAILPRQLLVDEFKGKVTEDGTETTSVYSRGGTTAANVLSINLVAVWNRDAYLFTGDAHLKDVTEAARDFLADHGMESFKYVDVPHHGSAKSNVEKVDDEDRGLAGIPAEQYLISHCGDHQNPSFQTVKDILTREECQILHFLYQERKRKPRVKNATGHRIPGISCKECQVGNTTTTENWHCNCVREEMQAKIAVPLTCHYWECFKFFPFVDYDFVVFNFCS